MRCFSITKIKEMEPFRQKDLLSFFFLLNGSQYMELVDFLINDGFGLISYCPAGIMPKNLRILKDYHGFNIFF